MKERGGAFCAALVLSVTLSVPAHGQDRPVLELSLDDAVQRALQNNLDIAVDKFGHESSTWGLEQLRGSYEPLVTSLLSNGSVTEPPRDAFTGGSKVATDSFTFNLGAAQEFRTGGRLRLDFTNLRQGTNSVFSTFDPVYASKLAFNVTQPLLRNLKIDPTREAIRAARVQRDLSEAALRQTTANTVADVKMLYYDLLFAIDYLEAQRRNLALARKLMDDNRIRVQAGAVARADAVIGESEMAGREEAVVVAESNVEAVEDALKRAIFTGEDSSIWALRIVPTYRPAPEPPRIDEDAALNEALASRTDMLAARKRLERAQVSVDFAGNQRLPALDLVAEYGALGIGGTQLTREGLGGPIVSQINGSYGDALSAVRRRVFPTWLVGLSFSYPVLNRQGRAASARAQADRDGAEAELRRQALLITTDVRDAARSVRTNFRRVETTTAARKLQRQRLDNELQRFAAGMSTSFFVIQAQRDLAAAEVSELKALADYRKSQAEFERAQQAGPGRLPR